MAVTLLYEAGEGANEEMSKPGCGSLGQLALGERPFPSQMRPFAFLSLERKTQEDDARVFAALMQVDAPSANHRLVSLALMETYVRYNRVLAQHPQVLSRILGFFLGENGIGHKDTVSNPRALLRRTAVGHA